jgi:tetratricopeptide (TPR) repeat protein
MDVLAGNTIRQVLGDDFYRIMDRYTDHNYDGAIILFRQLEPRVAVINPQNCTPKEKEFLQDFYFYYAASQLASLNAKKGGKNIDSGVIDSAISNLRRAEKLAPAQNDTDRETFFLGLAYGMAGDETTAERQLALVQTDVGLMVKAQFILNQIRQ